METELGTETSVDIILFNISPSCEQKYHLMNMSVIQPDHYLFGIPV